MEVNKEDGQLGGIMEINEYRWLLAVKPNINKYSNTGKECSQPVGKSIQAAVQ